MELIEVLRRIAPFSELDPSSLATLASRSYRRAYRTGETLFHQGEPAAAVYVILSGHVNLQIVTASGTVTLVGRRGPGETLGDVSVIEERRRMADAITADVCDLVVIDARDFLQCMENSARFSRKVTQGLAARLRTLVDWRTRDAAEDPMDRVSALILELMDVYGTEETGAGRRINIRVTQQEMAEQIGVKRECVNRKLSWLQQRGIIRLDGRQIVVLNEARLLFAKQGGEIGV